MGDCDGATESERQRSFPVTAFLIISKVSPQDLQPLLHLHVVSFGITEGIKLLTAYRISISQTRMDVCTVMYLYALQPYN